MSINQWATLLETISFFLVTIDLFGRDTLERFQNLVKTLSSNLRSINLWDRVRWRKVQSSRSVVLLYISYAIFVVSAIIYNVFCKLGLNSLAYVGSYVLGLAITFAIVRFLTIRLKASAVHVFLIFVQISSLSAIIALFFWNQFGRYLLMANPLSIFSIIIVLELTGILIKIIEYVLDGFLGFSIFLLAKTKIEGLMLILGAILFMISKVIAFITQ